MRASRLSLLKDIFSGLVLIGFLLIGMFLIMPGIQTSQITELEKQYTKEQRLIVRQTVENTALGMIKLRSALRAAGMDQKKADDLILFQLRADRFGVNGYGYFFVLDESLTLLVHSVQKDLEGRRLADISSPDGKNLGVLFSEALRDGTTPSWNTIGPSRSSGRSKRKFPSS